MAEASNGTLNIQGENTLFREPEAAKQQQPQQRRQDRVSGLQGRFQPTREGTLPEGHMSYTPVLKPSPHIVLLTIPCAPQYLALQRWKTSKGWCLLLLILLEQSSAEVSSPNDCSTILTNSILHRKKRKSLWKRILAWLALWLAEFLWTGIWFYGETLIIMKCFVPSAGLQASDCHHGESNHGITPSFPRGQLSPWSLPVRLLAGLRNDDCTGCLHRWLSATSGLGRINPAAITLSFSSIWNGRPYTVDPLPSWYWDIVDSSTMADFLPTTLWTENGT